MDLAYLVLIEGGENAGHRQSQEEPHFSLKKKKPTKIMKAITAKGSHLNILLRSRFVLFIGAPSHMT